MQEIKEEGHQASNERIVFKVVSRGTSIRYRKDRAVYPVERIEYSQRLSRNQKLTNCITELVAHEKVWLFSVCFHFNFHTSNNIFLFACEGYKS